MIGFSFPNNTSGGECGGDCITYRNETRPKIAAKNKTTYTQPVSPSKISGNSILVFPACHKYVIQKNKTADAAKMSEAEIIIFYLRPKSIAMLNQPKFLVGAAGFEPTHSGLSGQGFGQV